MKLNILPLVALSLLSGCGHEAQSSALSAAREANEQIQLAMAEAGCSGQSEPNSLCDHLKAAQTSIDNTIYRMGNRDH